VQHGGGARWGWCNVTRWPHSSTVWFD